LQYEVSKAGEPIVITEKRQQLNLLYAFFKSGTYYIIIEK